MIVRLGWTKLITMTHPPFMLCPSNFQGGVSGNGVLGCDAIVVSDNQPILREQDHFFWLLYSSNSFQRARAEFKSFEDKSPIRVFRSSQMTNRLAPPANNRKTQYRYDGLYEIKHVWDPDGVKDPERYKPPSHKHLPYTFLLKKIDNHNIESMYNLIKILAPSCTDKRGIGPLLAPHILASPPASVQPVDIESVLRLKADKLNTCRKRRLSSPSSKLKQRAPSKSNPVKQPRELQSKRRKQEGSQTRSREWRGPAHPHDVICGKGGRNHPNSLKNLLVPDEPDYHRLDDRQHRSDFIDAKIEAVCRSGGKFIRDGYEMEYREVRICICKCLNDIKRWKKKWPGCELEWSRTTIEATLSFDCHATLDCRMPQQSIPWSWRRRTARNSGQECSIRCRVHLMISLMPSRPTWEISLHTAPDTWLAPRRSSCQVWRPGFTDNNDTTVNWQLPQYEARIGAMLVASERILSLTLNIASSSPHDYRIESSHVVICSCRNWSSNNNFAYSYNTLSIQVWFRMNCNSYCDNSGWRLYTFSLSL